MTYATIICPDCGRMHFGSDPSDGCPITSAQRLIERTYNLGELEADAKCVAKALIAISPPPSGTGKLRGGG
jgi:hypothetical protein